MSIPFSPAQFEKKSTRAIPRTNVRLDKLVPTQRYHDQAKVDDIAAKGVNQTGITPIVHAFAGKYFVADGHHRVAAAIQRGDHTIQVKRVK